MSMPGLKKSFAKCMSLKLQDVAVQKKVMLCYEYSNKIR